MRRVPSGQNQVLTNSELVAAHVTLGPYIFPCRLDRKNSVTGRPGDKDGLPEMLDAVSGSAFILIIFMSLT